MTDAPSPVEAAARALLGWLPMDGGDVDQAARAALRAAIEALPELSQDGTGHAVRACAREALLGGFGLEEETE